MSNVDFFYEKLNRLKEELGKTKDKEVAEALGIGEKAFNARKTRGSFPEKELRALAQQHPDIALNVDYVLTGGLLTQREREHLASARALTQQLPVEDAEKQRQADIAVKQMELQMDKYRADLDAQTKLSIAQLDRAAKAEIEMFKARVNAEVKKEMAEDRAEQMEATQPGMVDD